MLEQEDVESRVIIRHLQLQLMHVDVVGFCDMNFLSVEFDMKLKIVVRSAFEIMKSLKTGFANWTVDSAEGLMTSFNSMIGFDFRST